MADEQTISTPETTEKPAAPEGQPPETASDATPPIASIASDEPFKIPEKLVGKSPEDIVRSYVGVEKVNGKLAQEKDVYAKRVKQLEGELEQIRYRAPVQPHRAVTWICPPRRPHDHGHAHGLVLQPKSRLPAEPR